MSDDLMPETTDAEPVDVMQAGHGGSIAKRPARRSRKGRVLLALTVLVVLILVPLGALFGWYWLQVHPGGKPGAAEPVEIKSGWGIRQIGDELERTGVIGSSLAFRVYVAIDGNPTFSSGRYDLREGMGVADAVRMLHKGPVVVYGKLALPPGLTLDDIATRVGQQPGRSKERFLAAARSGQIRSAYQPPNINSLEGLTWPDTYYITEVEDETAILRRLVSAFDGNANAIGLNGSLTNGWTPYQTIVVASLIQTEAKVDADRALIASVVQNRLRDRMPLQIDATLLYARGDRTSPIRNSDKQIDSPYNTYKVAGLPPTPISTVSKLSLQAAMKPAATAYKFYVLADKDGSHAFAVTLAEHDRNVAEARRKGLL